MPDRQIILPKFPKLTLVDNRPTKWVIISKGIFLNTLPMEVLSIVNNCINSFEYNYKRIAVVNLIKSPKILFLSNSCTLTWNLITASDHYHFTAQSGMSGCKVTTITTVSDWYQKHTWTKLIPLEQTSTHTHHLHDLFSIIIYTICRFWIPVVVQIFTLINLKLLVL